jgi:hypothetical protein
MALPNSPWFLGKQPVDMEAEFTRVAEGNTLRWRMNTRDPAAMAASTGVYSGVTISARRPSIIMSTARFMAIDQRSSREA